MPASPPKRTARSASFVDHDIGARVRARRLEIDMSQERLAGAIGVTFQQIQKYEKGVNRVAAATLIEIAKALDISISALLPERSSRMPGTAQSDRAFAELGAIYTNLNSEGRSLLLSTAKTFMAQRHLTRRK